MTNSKRNLYQCFNARVLFKRIYCSNGHRLNEKSTDGTVNIERLIRGEPLILGVCQHCPSYDEMGPPIPKNERGYKEV